MGELQFSSSRQAPSQCGNSSSLREPFARWTNHVNSNLLDRHASGGSRYESGEDKRLLQVCEEHACLYSAPLHSEKLVVLVHPFYIHLSHEKYLTPKNRDELKEYDSNLSRLLSIKHSLELGIVALETIHHYAARTSGLLQEGLINRVIFTEYDDGEPLHCEELDEFSGKDLFFAGGYNGFCLTVAINSFERVTSKDKAWAIKDLIVESAGNLTLRPRTIYANRKFPADRVISLKEALEL